MKSYLPLFFFVTLCSYCTSPELTGKEKFDSVSVGMKLEEALDVFGLKDTFGKSYVHFYPVAKITSENGDSVILEETGDTFRVIYIAFDSVYTFAINADTIAQKFDNTIMNRLLDSLEKARGNQPMSN